MAPPHQHLSQKAELHLHLEGSLEPATLKEFDPALTDEEIAARYRYRDFPQFIESYLWAIQHLNRPEDYAQAARRLLERLERENIMYAEITLSAAVIPWRKQDLCATYEAIWDECLRSRVTARWVWDSVRQWGVEPAQRTVETAAKYVDRGVVAFGIGGNEQLGPVEWFGDVFRYARDHGMRLTVHAGETAGPESVRGAICLGAERIGHGIRSIDDPELVAELRDRAIPLEICISSNLATGAVARLEEHPVRRLYDAGVPIVLGTDDPAMFHTDLEHEYDLARTRFGFTDDELNGIAANAWKYRFV
ncbi:MAG TPA: adenosine deaminase [Bryobacteraceae bacterium]|nr:adenosine deaminase [Bryobacteraceae bacterium]